MVLKSISNRGVDVAKWIGLAVTIVGLIVSVVVWASGEHDDLKDNARLEAKESVKDLKETMKEQYTPLHEFTKIEQKIDDQSDRIEDNSKKIDKIDDDIGKLDNKLDTLLEKVIRRNNRNE